MPDNVFDLPVITTLKTDPERVLKAAEDKLETAVVIGWRKDDEGQFYFGSSEPNAAEVIMTIEKVRAAISAILAISRSA